MFLTPDKIRTISIAGRTLTINEKIIPDNMVAPKDVASWIKKGQPMKPRALLGGNGKPRGVTVHNTNMITAASGTNAAEQYSRATFNGNMAGVVVHFYVWRKVIWQILKENERGWHSTDGSSRRSSQRTGEMIGGNIDTIAIEAIGDDAVTTETTALLTAHLLKTHNLVPDTDVYTHKYFYPVKFCPAYILPNWSGFMAQVADFYNVKEGDGLFRVQCDAFKTWDLAVNQYYKLIRDGYKPMMVQADGFFKVQVDAFRNESGADTRGAELKSRGYNIYITTKAGVPVSMAV